MGGGPRGGGPRELGGGPRELGGGPSSRGRLLGGPMSRLDGGGRRSGASRLSSLRGGPRGGALLPAAT